MPIEREREINDGDLSNSGIPSNPAPTKIPSGNRKVGCLTNISLTSSTFRPVSAETTGAGCLATPHKTQDLFLLIGQRYMMRGALQPPGKSGEVDGGIRLHRITS